MNTGDACVVGSESYADFREQLLSERECELLIENYSKQLGFPSNSDDFVEYLRKELTDVAMSVDKILSDGKQVTISKNGEPVLKKIAPLDKPKGVEELGEAIRQKMPERGVLDILSNVEHWLNWTRHFGPLSGSEAKIRLLFVRAIALKGMDTGEYCVLSRNVRLLLLN